MSEPISSAMNEQRQPLNRTYTTGLTLGDEQALFQGLTSARQSQQSSYSNTGSFGNTNPPNDYRNGLSLYTTATASVSANAPVTSATGLHGQQLRRTMTAATPSTSQQDYLARPISQQQSQQNFQLYGSIDQHEFNQNMSMASTPVSGQIDPQRATSLPSGLHDLSNHNDVQCPTATAVLPGLQTSYQTPATNAGFLAPLRPYTAPVDSGLPLGITPYLPPRRELPFARPSENATNSGMKYTRTDTSRPSTAQPTTSMAAPERPERLERPQTAAPGGMSNAGQMLLFHREQQRSSPTASTISSPTRRSTTRGSDSARPSSSIGPGSSPLKKAYGISDHNSSPPRQPAVSVTSAVQNRSPFTDKESDHPVPQGTAATSTFQPSDEAAVPATPSVYVGGADMTTTPASQGTKRPKETATGNSPPKKRAPAKKKVSKATTTTAISAPADVNTLLLDYFKDFDVNASLQGFMERPRSGRQEFVNELICQHLRSEAFMEFAEHVENAWCKIGLEHPNSEMERERLTSERAYSRR